MRRTRSSLPRTVRAESRLFQRNRTRAGDSVVAHDRSLSERHQAHQLRKVRRRLLRWFGILCLVVALVMLFMSQYSGRLVIRVDGNEVNSATNQTYSKLVQTYFASRPAETFRFLVHQETLEAYVHEHAPEIARIVIRGGEGADVFGVSTVYMTLRQPLVSWESSTGQHWYVDKEGVLFTHYTGKTIPHVTVRDMSGVPSKQGEVIVSQGFLGFVGELVGYLEASSLRVTQVVIPPGKTREVHITLKGAPYSIKATTTRSSYDQAEDISRVVRYLNKHDIRPLYIDVRVAGKAYYK